jgi:hypothetical protein
VYDKNGNLVKEIMPKVPGENGYWVYDQFLNGDPTKPTHGYNPETGQTVDIYYNADGTAEWDFSDGRTIITDKNGVPIEAIIPDGKGGYVDIVFKVQLQNLAKAYFMTVLGELAIEQALKTIKTAMIDIGEFWTGPAASKYHELSTSVGILAGDFKKKFNDAAERMRTTYNNYVTTEYANYQSLQDPPPKDTWHRKPPSH